MEITEKLYVTEAVQWRRWLEDNHEKTKEIWLVYYRKSSGRERIPYNDAVDQALSFGWIDSTIKSIDDQCYAQRFTPRRKKSHLSTMNKERIQRLREADLMTEAGWKAIEFLFDRSKKLEGVEISDDIYHALQEKEMVWKNFNTFSDSYKRIRIGFIEEARDRPDTFLRRLSYFIKMTQQNKKYGMLQ